MAAIYRRRKSTNKVAESKGENMADQEQQRMDDQFGAQMPEDRFLDAEPVETGFSNPDSAGEKGEDDWEDDESFLEDSSGRQMLFWIGGGVLVLVIIAILFFFIGGSSEPAGDFSGVSKQVRDMESRLGKLEANANAWNIKLDRIDQNQQTLLDQNTKLMARIEEVKRQAAARPAPVAAVTPAPRTAPAPAPAPVAKAPAERRYHVVQAGDTLYSIHKRYNVPLDTLRKLNTLKEHEPIYSGDRIYVE
ncbi:MAG: LysM peptidoglycan-binding domain-containing protein [Desulfatibacillum sp.]|nr:LysM peptidoglycan-binding domain-containing protein [Desulfatibacillum sp.]